MRKIAYPVGEEVPVKTPGPAESKGLSSTEIGSRGPSLVEMVNEFDNSSTPEEDSNSRNISDKSSDENFINFLVDLGDGLDEAGQEILASFSDFLIEKFASVKDMDPTSLFNNVILKIKRTDIADTNQVIKKLTKIYSRTILLENVKNKDLKKSKESAYKKVLHRAKQYLSES